MFEIFYPIQHFVNEEKWGELQGIVDGVGSKDVTMSLAVLINTLYEIESWCTSVIIRRDDGIIIHQRNLDFEISDVFTKVVHEARFYKNGKHIFDSIMFAGNLGIYTGYKEGKFSISENQRFPNEHKSGLLLNMILSFTGFKEISWSIRDVLTNQESWDHAYSVLRDQPISALGYIILAGREHNEGVIISRNRFSEAHEERLNSTQWFLVQTNNDHWDTGCFNRCAAATTRIQ